MRPHYAIFGVVGIAACGGPSSDPSVSQCDLARGSPMDRFNDVTEQSGVAFEYWASGFQGGGLAVTDLDGDDLPDLVAGRRGGGFGMFQNLGAMRFRAVVDPGIPASIAATAIGAADLDNDGDRELVVAGAGGTYVMSNLGDGRFAESARFLESGTTEHVLPTDLDGDGLLDLHFSNYDVRSAARTENRLYINRGGLQFAEVDVPGKGLSWTATAFDFDADGDQDLYIANDTLLADFGTADSATSPWPVDLLLRNDGRGSDGVPRFTDLAAEVGLATPRSSMGGLLGDFDEDGHLDLFVPDFGAKKLFLRDPSGGYIESAAAFGLAAITRDNTRCPPGNRAQECLVLSWSAALADFDLDGSDELLVVNGDTSLGSAPPVLLFTRGPDSTFVEVSPNIPCMDARGLVVTDLDADGDQDIVVAHKDGPLAIYENRGKPAAETWLQIMLRGQTSNREGIGAVVTATLRSGRTVIRTVGAGGVIHSAGPAEAFFGLGADVVERVEVLWPSGRRTELVQPPSGLVIVDEAQ